MTMTTHRRATRAPAEPMLRAAAGTDATDARVDATPIAAPTVPAMVPVLRIGTGLVFLWAFLDKAFGLGYATPSSGAWIRGGSPTNGFLSHVAVGPLESTMHDWAGTLWADWLFMLGLLAIGTALVLGIAMRLAAVATAVMMALMWAAEWPLARHTSAGEPSGSNNPIVDYHVIYALAAAAVASIAGAGDRWGLGRQWRALPVIRDHRWLQ
jgi:thiosulfate dehydrogenase [quinone] large subunit